ncbi:MAG: carbohydrate ABC transporter substrate-binding protein [Eubacteriales bacterium]|jgi:multiple sugar transport system substrate-binding protein
MKKEIVSVMLSAAMAAALAGCGSSASTTSSTGSTASSAAGSVVTSTESTSSTAGTANPGTTDTGSGEGKVLNIQVWNTEFAQRMADHLPGYTAKDPDDPTAGGKIGDVTVKFTVTPTDDNAYQNNLDEVLPNNSSASDDDKVDIFLVEADYAKKYVDADANVAMKLSDLGITDDDLADQYQYTKDVVTDANGDIRGSSWQACSAGLIYNRAIAKQVLGTDDPTEVQKAVADWSSFNATAEKVKAAGYQMCSAMDTYRTYSNNVKSPCVVDNKLVIDDNINAWIDDSKKLVDAGEETSNELWGDDWSKGFFTATPQFCYFGPAWFFNFSMHNDEDGAVGKDGGWGFCKGPQGYFWGGTWICAATGTDNPTLVKNIILEMTTDKTVLKDIAVKDSDCVNSQSVLKELSSSDEGNIACLGGQNPYAELAAGAETIDMSNLSIYDQGFTEEIQKAMKDYFDGNASKDEALASFKKAMQEKYPDITVD